MKVAKGVELEPGGGDDKIVPLHGPDLGPQPARVVRQWLGDVSAQTLSELARDGIAVRIGKDKYDLQATVINAMRHYRAGAAGRQSSGTLDLSEERARQVAATADKIEMENAVTRGELVRREDVGQMVVAVLLRLRAALLRLPAKVAARAAGKTQAELRVALDEQVREALEELAALERE